MISELLASIICIGVGVLTLISFWNSPEYYNTHLFLAVNIGGVILIILGILFIKNLFITHDIAGQRWLFGRRI